MTDPYKYRSISLRNKTYSKLEDLTNIVVPGSTLSNAKTVEILIDEKHRNSQGRPKGIANEKTQQEA